MTALARALREAGFEPAPERLRRIAAEVVRLPPEEWARAPAAQGDPEHQRRLRLVAREAVKAHPRNWDAAKDAFFARVRGDAALLWELFAPYRAEAAQKLLAEVAREIREEEMPRAATPARESGAGHPYSGNRPPAARPARPALDVAKGIAFLGNIARRSLLDTFIVNGRPVGDVTAREAQGWAASQARNARWVALLAENLPPDDPIRRWRTPEDAEALFERAKREAGNA